MRIRPMLTALLVLGLVGCGRPVASVLGPTTSVRGLATGAPWVMRSYFAWDNPLDAGQQHIEALHAVAARAHSLAVGTFYDGWQRTDTYYFLQQAPGQPVQRQDHREVDSATIGALSEFLTCSTQATPGQRSTLTIADHGGGIVRGICTDDNGAEDSVMRIADLAVELPRHPVELLMFDACYMNMIEVAYELRQGARYVLGGQSELYRGDFPYAAVGQTLEDHASEDSNAVARQVFGVVAGAARADTAHGLVDTARSVEVATQLRRVSEVLLSRASDMTRRRAIRATLREAQSYANWGGATSMVLYNEYRDLVDVMDRLAGLGDLELATAASAVAAATRAAVLAEAHKPGAELPLTRVHGVAIYAPAGVKVAAPYLASPWNQATRWGDAMVAINSDGKALALEADPFPRAFPRR